MATATLELTLKQPAARQLDQRLMVAMYDFVPKGEVPPLVRNALFPAFYSEMKKRQRFRVFERDRLEKILLEQQIAATMMTDKRYQSRLGEITAADLLLFGQVIDASQGMEIYIDAVNRRQPDQPIPSVSVYLPGRDTERLDWAAKGLYLKLSDEFPLVEGKVQGLVKEDVLTDLGLEERIRTGSRLYVFRKMDHYVEGGVDLGPVEVDVGVLRVRKAAAEQSYSEIIDKSPEFQIQRGDYVITE